MSVDKKMLMVAGILIIASIILVGPNLLRSINGNVYMSNIGAYETLKMMNASKGMIVENTNEPMRLIYLLHINFYYLRIMITVSAIILLILFYFILKKQNITDYVAYSIIAILILSPSFLYYFSDYSHSGFALLFILLSIYLFMNEKYIYAGILFIIIPFIDIYGAIIASVFILLYSVLNKKNMVTSYMAWAFTLGACIFNIINGFLFYKQIVFVGTSFITDIGASIGYSFSSVILSLIGIILLWSKGWKNLLIYSSIIGLILLSIIIDELRIYLTFIIAIYAGFAFMYLNRRKWSIPIIKKVTLLLIVCSLLFSTLVYVTRNIKAEPTNDYVDGLLVLKTQALYNEKILSDPEKSSMIEFFSSREVAFDSHALYYKDYKTDYINLLKSRNFEKTNAILEKYSIKYIVIDEDFRQALEEKEGLMFLMDSSSRFRTIYKNPKIQIMMFLGKN